MQYRISGGEMKRQEIQTLTGHRFLIPAGVPILGSTPAAGYLGMTLFFCAERFCKPLVESPNLSPDAN
jgi:hypothetical protein